VVAQRVPLVLVPCFGSRTICPLASADNIVVPQLIAGEVPARSRLLESA